MSNCVSVGKGMTAVRTVEREAVQSVLISWAAINFFSFC